MNRQPPTIDMLPDGSFRTPPPQRGLPFSMKLGLGAILVAAVGLSLTIAAIAVWIISVILPVVIVAGAIAWGALKYRQWRLRGHQALHPHQPGSFRQ